MSPRKLRDTNLDKLASVRFDVLVLGGGINGALRAASRGPRRSAAAGGRRAPILQRLVQLTVT
jgi:hypothetical protein